MEEEGPGTWKVDEKGSAGTGSWKDACGGGRAMGGQREEPRRGRLPLGTSGLPNVVCWAVYELGKMRRQFYPGKHAFLWTGTLRRRWHVGGCVHGAWFLTHSKDSFASQNNLLHGGCRCCSLRKLESSARVQRERPLWSKIVPYPISWLNLSMRAVSTLSVWQSRPQQREETENFRADGERC